MEKKLQILNNGENLGPSSKPLKQGASIAQVGETIRIEL
jgi:hypothetical protein